MNDWGEYEVYLAVYYWSSETKDYEWENVLFQRYKESPDGSRTYDIGKNADVKSKVDEVSRKIAQRGDDPQGQYLVKDPVQTIKPGTKVVGTKVVKEAYDEKVIVLYKCACGAKKTN